MNPRFLDHLKQAGLDPAQARPFATAHEIAPGRHLAMQAVFQTHTDNGASKTVKLPAAATTAEVTGIFIQVHALGLKGITVFRKGSRDRQILRLLRGQRLRVDCPAGTNRSQ